MQEQPDRPDQPAVGAKLEELAVAGGVGSTPHAVAVDRAHVAVANVNETFGEVANNGDLREMNAAFRAARTADPSLRYVYNMEARMDRWYRDFCTLQLISPRRPMTCALPFGLL
jgi:hypothetical protein